MLARRSWNVLLALSFARPGNDRFHNFSRAIDKDICERAECTTFQCDEPGGLSRRRQSIGKALIAG
jgi:hypothetical protein